MSLNKNLLSYLVFAFLSIFVLYTIDYKVDYEKYPPVPTEYVQKKKDRKLFKKQRDEYIQRMYLSDPDVDWKKMEADYRSKRSDETSISRSNTSRDDGHIESFFNRDLEGYWEERGSNNNAGRVHTIDVDFNNEMIYCASSGGNIWKGTLDGIGWVSLNDYMQIDNINMVRAIPTSSNQNRILVSSGNKFYWSDDECYVLNEATGLENVAEWGEIYRSVVTYSDSQQMNQQPTVYVLTKEWNNGSEACIYKSEDLGESFELIYHTSLQTERGYDIWTDRYQSSDIYFLRNRSIYKIGDDNQLTLISEVTSDGEGKNILSGGMSSSGGGEYHFYAMINSELYFSDNSGESWNYKGELPSYTFSRNSFNASYREQDVVSIGGIEVFTSLDGGTSWDKVNNWWDYYGNPSIYLHADIPEVQYLLNAAGHELTFVSTDGGLYKSDDYLNTVENISLNGLGVSQYYSTYTKRTHPYNVYAGSQDQGFQRSTNQTDGGIYDFDQVISGDYGHLVSGNDGFSIWTVYPGFAMFYSNAALNNSGITWDFQGSGYLWIPPLLEDPYDPNSVFLAGGGLSGGNHILHLTAIGNTISVDEHVYNFNSTVSAMAYSPIDPSHRYALTSNGKFYHSSNGGLSWSMSSSFTGPDAHYFYGSDILASSVELGKVIISGSGYSNPPVYVTHDHGNSFEAMDEGLPGTLVFALTSTEEESYVFAATSIGPFAFSESDQIWVDIMGLDAPDQTYWSVDYIPELHTVRYGTYGRGIWDFIVDENIDVLYGDLNQDGTINIQDVILLVNISISNIEPDDSQIISGDINSDGQIDVLDIILCVNLILNS